MGIHLLGNKGKVDGLGFLEPDNDTEVLLNSFFVWMPD